MTLNYQADISRSRWGFLLAAVVVAMLAGAMFLPGLGGGFILDDGPNIQENRLLHLSQLGAAELIYAALSYAESGWRALPMLSFALDYWRGEGLDAPAFKVTNILIHVVTTLALALFFRRLLWLVGWKVRCVSIVALLLALAWAIHPLQVSSVLYVVQRMQTMCTLFVVLALWAYLGMRQAQIEGVTSRGNDALLVLFTLLALFSKEDAALLPLYMLALELTVLRFHAASSSVGNALRKGYLLLVLIGLAVYLFVLIPHYWQWGAYAGREFSSPERLLTQGRVLVMYLGQILFPLPSTMPFHYDDLPISRGWLQPWTTVPAWLLLLALLAMAWRLRQRLSLFSLGIMLFFAGHFMTSNVLDLELAFEHRNSFPLIGMVLAVAELVRMAWERWGVARQWQVLMLSAVMIGLASGTLMRAHAWGEPLRFAKYSVILAPHSARAWLELGGTYAGLSKWEAGSPWLSKAIDTLDEGAKYVDSTTLLSNLVLYKTIQGSIRQSDWWRLHDAFRLAPATALNRGIISTMMRNLRFGVPLDQDGVFEIFEIMRTSGSAGQGECIEASYFAIDRNMPAEKVLPFLRCAVTPSSMGDPPVVALLKRLEGGGYGGLVMQLGGVESPASSVPMEKAEGAGDGR